MLCRAEIKNGTQVLLVRLPAICAEAEWLCE